jgi:hypothetical protein
MAHVDHSLSKVLAKRFYCLKMLVHAGVTESDIITICCSFVLLALEYACPVWHQGQIKKLSNETERIQKKMFEVSVSYLDYSAVLSQAQLEHLEVRRKKFSTKTV